MRYNVEIPRTNFWESGTTLSYMYMECLMIIANLPIKSPKIQRPEATLLAYPSLLLASQSGGGHDVVQQTAQSLALEYG